MEPALAPFIGALSSQLTQSLIGAYLYGSAVEGGLRRQGDLDVLVAADRPILVWTRRALGDALLALSGWNTKAGPSRPLDVTVVVVGDVNPWRYPPRCEFLFGEWLRGDFEAGRPDLAIALSGLRKYHRRLLGKPSAEVFDGVPLDDVRRAVLACLPSLLHNLRGDERNVILTLARMWLTASTGAIMSKDYAAEWALARLPEQLQ